MLDRGVACDAGKEGGGGPEGVWTAAWMRALMQVWMRLNLHSG